MSTSNDPTPDLDEVKAQLESGIGSAKKLLEQAKVILNGDSDSVEGALSD